MGVYEIIYGIKAGGFSGHYIKRKCQNIIEKENCSQQVLTFVTIKTEQSKEYKPLLEESASFSLPRWQQTFTFPIFSFIGK